MRAETLKGHLDGILLAVLEPGPRHGYAIMEALRTRSEGHVDLPTGTVYPALHRLERAGLVQAAWSEAGGRRRRVYELTTAGRQALDSERSTWRDFSAVVSSLLQPAQPGLGRGESVMSPAVERYLDQITTRLPGPPRSHQGIVAELRAGLLDAIDSHERNGMSPAQAAEAAIAEFGDPAELADGFLAEIAAGQARKVAVILLVTGPLVGLLWIGTATASHVVVHLASLWHLTGQRGVFALGIQLVAVTATVTAWAAVLGIAATGRLTRWLPVRPRRAPTVVAVAGIGAVGADALGLAMLAVELAIAPGQLAIVPAAAAAVASLGRILLARRSAIRCLALRARLA